MNKTSRALAYILCAGLVVGACWGGYELYQEHYLSPEIKAALIAGLDPASNVDDLMTSLSDIRRRARTRKDVEIVEKFQRATELTVESSHMGTRTLNEAMESVAPADPGAAPSTISGLADQQAEQAAPSIDLEAQAGQAPADARKEKKQADDEARTAKKLYAEIRAELGVR
jgi:hypothetical protein